MNGQITSEFTFPGCLFLSNSVSSPLFSLAATRELNTTPGHLCTCGGKFHGISRSYEAQWAENNTLTPSLKPQEPFSCTKLPSVSETCVHVSFFFRSIKSVCFFIQEQKQNVLYLKRILKSAGSPTTLRTK